MKNPFKILCVDDELELLSILKDILKDLEVEILTASRVSEARELIEEHGSRIVGIVSDLNMPEESGMAFRKSLLEKYKHIPFVVLSAYITKELALSALEIKVAAFVDKPFDRHQLLDVVRRETKDRIEALREEDELLEGFNAEASALLEEIEALCLNLEENPDDIEVINRIFACAHTIKGASGYFKPDYVHRFSHRFEDYFSTFKSGSKKIGSHEISVCLKAIDILKGLVGDLSSLKPQERDLDELSEIFSVSARDKSQDENSKVTKSPIKSKVQSVTKTSDVKVSLDLLDQFMEKSGEITVLRNMVNKTLKRIEHDFPNHADVGSLAEILGEMHKTTSEMQEQIGDLRKVSLTHTLKPMQRTVRDLSLSLKKKIHLDLVGQDNRVDHVLAEALSKCLIHMVRNSADHGIESEEIRIGLGKSEVGTLQIAIEIQNDYLNIQVSDDGAGIDANRIGKKAIEKEILTEEQLVKMSESEIQMLVFHPGFSTSEKVTDVSGRGVGMDMVAKTIQQLGGNISIDSKVSQGTKFFIRLPIPKSVLITNSLLIQVKGRTFALPQENIIRVIQIERPEEKKRIQKIKDNFFYSSRERLLPIICLDSVLKISDFSLDLEKPITLVVVKGKAGHFCLCVDEIQDIEDTVVKRIGGWLNGLHIYSGATFLGDGKVGLILDVEGISELANMRLAIEGSELNEKVDAYEEVTESDSSSQSLILLLESLRGQTYGIRQQELFRLEECSFDEIQQSCGQQVLLYRGRTMPVFFLDELVGEDGNNYDNRPQTLSLIVSKREDEKYMGFAVQKIRDLVFLSPRSPTLTGQRGESRVIEGRTVTLLNLEELTKKAQLRIA